MGPAGEKLLSNRALAGFLYFLSEITGISPASSRSLTCWVPGYAQHIEDLGSEQVVDHHMRKGLAVR